MKKEDIKIKCVDCGEEFIFTVGEQEFFDSKGFTNLPKRCAKCRKQRQIRAEGRKIELTSKRDGDDGIRIRAS